MARVGTRTTSCVLAGERFSSIANRPNSCATVFIDLPKEIARSASSGRDSSGKSLPQGYRPWGVRWGKKLTQPGTSIKRSCHKAAHLRSNIRFHQLTYLSIPINSFRPFTDGRPAPHPTHITSAALHKREKKARGLSSLAQRNVHRTQLRRKRQSRKNYTAEAAEPRPIRMEGQLLPGMCNLLPRVLI